MVTGVSFIPLPAPRCSGTANRQIRKSSRDTASCGFFAGIENRLALHVANSLLRPEGPPLAYNPLVLYGSAGCGKSHLARGLAAAWQEAHPVVRAGFSTRDPVIETTVDGLLASAGSIEEDMTPRGKLNAVSLVVIDDLDASPHRLGTQHQLQSVFDALLCIGTQIVVTTRQVPALVPWMIPTLRSRLSAGLVVPIAQPAAETRAAIIIACASAHHVPLTDRAAKLLATKVESVSEALDVLAQLSNNSADDEPIDVAAVTQLFARRNPRRVTLSQITSQVSRHFGFKSSDLRGRSRRQKLSLARSIAMYIAWKRSGLSLNRIGHYFDRRDHTTVLHSCRKVQALLKSEADTQQAVTTVDEKLNTLIST